jgi:hypothetical protein
VIPHQVLILLKLKGGYWLTAGRLGRLSSHQLDNTNVILKSMPTLNPANLLQAQEDEPLHHKGLEVLETEYSSRMDLPDQLISKPH